MAGGRHEDFAAIEPEVRKLLAHAGIDTDCPEQVVRGMLMVTAAAIVRLARIEDCDITDAARIAQMAGMQLPRLVVQMGSRSKCSASGGHPGNATRKD